MLSPLWHKSPGNDAVVGLSGTKAQDDEYDLKTWRNVT